MNIGHLRTDYFSIHEIDERLAWAEGCLSTACRTFFAERMKIIDPPKQPAQPFYMSTLGRKSFNNSDRYNEQEKEETDEERKERKLREYKSQFPRWKFAHTVTKNGITCSARNPLPQRSIPPGLEIDPDTFVLEAPPLEIKILPHVPLPTVEDIERMIKEDKEEKEN